MIGVGEIATALTSISTALEIAKSIHALTVDTAVSAKVFELQRVMSEIVQQLLASQSEQAALSRRIHDLEAQVARFENWDGEKQRYELKELAPGTLVYRTKPGMENGEPVHDLCPHCYQQGVKSILQRSGFAQGCVTHTCPHCQTSFIGERIPLDDAVSYDDDPRSRRMI